MVEISIDCGVDKRTGRNTCDDNSSSSRDSRHEKETRINGRDDSSSSNNHSYPSNRAPQSSNKINNTEEQPKSQKPSIQLPKKLYTNEAVKSAAQIISQATGQRLQPVSAMLPGMTQIDMAIMSGLQSNNPSMLSIKLMSVS